MTHDPMDLWEDRLVAEALASRRESRRIEYKREFDPETPGAWCELLKDVAAIANSDGGVIVIGLDDGGSASGWKPDDFLALDTAEIVGRWSKYLGEQFDGFEIREGRRGRRRVAMIVIARRAGSPLVFEKPGTYAEGDRQRTAFSKGTVYFRHGARSDPGSARDIARFVDREVKRQRKEWLHNVRMVAAAPEGSQVVVVPSSRKPGSSPTTVRVVDDPDAPAALRTDFDKTHPHRQKEVIGLLNETLSPIVVTSHDLQCVRRVHPRAESEPFFHRPKFGSPQYSDGFVSWLIERHQRDHMFFEKAKQKVREEMASDSAGG